MSGHGLVTDVEQVSAKQGEPVWQIVTDYDPGPSPDGLRRCAVWIMRLDKHGNVLPCPMRGDAVTWNGRHVSWGAMMVNQVDHEFDPNDPHLFTG